jgi:hypothetical protein
MHRLGNPRTRKHAFFTSLVIVACILPQQVLARTEAAVIKELSQEFSDASARGDRAVFDRDLDDRVVFVNEDGDIATKADLLAVTPHPPGVNQTLRQADFKVTFHRNVAVTSFTDESTVHAYGQVVRARFRSTEVWLREGDCWKMISSQTIALQDDPPAIALASATLDEYVGTYRAVDGTTVTIARAGSNLTASLAGGRPTVLLAEVKDVFFAAGQPRIRRIFDRNSTGAITAYVSRHEGHDFVFTRVA